MHPNRDVGHMQMPDDDCDALLTEFCWFAERFPDHAAAVLTSWIPSPSAYAALMYNSSDWQSHQQTTLSTHTQLFYGPLSGSTPVSWYQKKHSSTRTLPAHQPSLSSSSIYHEPLHHPCSIHILGNLSAQPLTMSSLPASGSGADYFMLHTHLHPVIILLSQHMSIPS